MKSFVARTSDSFKIGDSVQDIIFYWLPELITSMILIALPPLIDAYIIANSQPVTSYSALATTTNFLHTLIKFAEAIPVAAIAMIGRHNGAREYTKCGEDLGNTFWLTAILGLAQFLIISAAATLIYRWHGVSEEMIALGAPFLRLKSFGVFLVFISLSFIYFMKGIKNTRMPMVLSMVGIAAFFFFDYALVLGKFGFPQCDLNGSAIATIIQYTVMNVIALAYILWEPEYKKYFSKIFLSFFNWKKIIHLVNLSWPIMVDKTSFAISYVWLAGLISPMGTPAIAAYSTIKDLERFAFLPAVAFAVIITFLVSNRLGANDPDGAMANIKKVLMLTGVTVGVSLLCLCLNARFFVSMFDPHNHFTTLGAAALPIISILVIFDFVQVILAGALRGAGDVHSVMYGRCATVFLFFIPVSYILSKLPIENQTARFVLIYGSHYVNAGLMGLIFLRRIMSHKWQKQKI